MGGGWLEGRQDTDHPLVRFVSTSECSRQRNKKFARRKLSRKRVKSWAFKCTSSTLIR